MNIYPLLARTVCLLAVFSFPLSALSQGDLNPPGAPAPTMLSLDQIGAKIDLLGPSVDARIIVNAINTPGDETNTFIISQPGSYYLTGNITGENGKNGISVQADDVTLDLNGFALISGAGAAVRGVDVPVVQTGFCIRNGSVRGWPDGGVRADTATTLAEKLRLTYNVGGTGLVVGLGSMVKDCVSTGNATGFASFDRAHFSNCIATINTLHGFVCTSYVTIIDCTSSRNGGTGIVVGGGSSVIRCSATRNLPEGDGIFTGGGCTVTDCTAGNNGFTGIWVGDGSTVSNCTAQANGLGLKTGAGIRVRSDCHVVGNTCSQNQNGMLLLGSGNRIDGNSLNFNVFRGLDGGMCVDYGSGNLIIRNSARGNPSNFVYCLDATGPIVDLSFGGGTITSTSPWANFIYGWEPKRQPQETQNNGASDFLAGGATRTGNHPAP